MEKGELENSKGRGEMVEKCEENGGNDYQRRMQSEKGREKGMEKSIERMRERTGNKRRM